MMTFKDFIHKYKFKNNAKSNMKIQSICKDTDIYLRVSPYEFDMATAICTHEKEQIALHL